MYLSLAIDQEYGARFDANLAVLLRAFLGAMGDAQAAASAPNRAGLREIAAALSGHPVSTLIKRATPYLHQEVRAFHHRSASGAGGPGDAELAPAMLWALDSYFELLPEEMELTVSGWGWPDLVLPRLGLAFEGAPGHMVLAKSGDTLKVWANPGRAQVRRSPCARSVVNEVDGVFTLATDAGYLFSGTAIPSIDPSPGAPGVLAGSIRGALGVIGRASFSLSASITRFVKWYVPLRTIDAHTHQSFTEARLPGVIFLSDHKDPVVLAEAIVHEFGHNKLNQYNSLFPLVETDIRGLYSPWRSDPRPLMGLLHALFVFTDVLTFLTAAERCGLFATQARARWLRSLTLCRIERGLRQVPNDRLTEPGRRLMDMIRRRHREQAAELGECSSGAREQVESHHQAWLMKNQSRLSP